MPEFTFTGVAARVYPESRDAHGVPIGTVQPGDTRDLDEPLDQFWEPAAVARDETKSPRRQRGISTSVLPDRGTDTAGTTTAGTDTAGETGSEES